MIISKKSVQIQFVARDIATILRGILQSMRGDGVVGQFTWVIGLNTKNETLYIDRLSPGPLRDAYWLIQGVFKQADNQGAASIVICQNRLAGNSMPSGRDKSIIARLSRSGEAFGVNILDHIIITETNLFSFRQCGLRSLLYTGSKTRVSHRRQRRRDHGL